MEDQRLRAIIASARVGSSEAYQALLEAYGPRLYGYFFRATRSHHDAEDMLAELMLRLVRRLKSYDERGRFERWLFRIAANIVRDRFRRMKVRPAAMSLSAEHDSDSPLAQRIAGDGPAVDDRMMAAEASAELNAAMEKLDFTTREMILLRYFGQMSFKELAKSFHCPLGTALARVHRGLRTLRRLMGPSDESD